MKSKFFFDLEVKAFFIILFFNLFIVATFLPGLSRAEMIEAGDEELAEITAGGFSRFAITGDTARAEFDITTWTYTQIDSMKLGYYDDGITGTGWDNDWTDISVGAPEQDLVTNGVFFEAVFENINDPANRTLKSVKFGFHDVTGTITADFNALSGHIAPGHPDNGHRTAPAFTEITLNGTGFYISLEIDGPNRGYNIHFDNAVTN